MKSELDLTTLPDADLVALIRGGNIHGPWQEIDRRYHAKAVGVARAVFRRGGPRCADEADDIANEALIKAYASLHRYDGRPFWPWLATVVSRKAIDRLRKLRARGGCQKTVSLALLGEVVADRSPPPPEQLIRQESLRTARVYLQRGLRRLPPRERRFLRRYHANHDRVARIAAEHGLAVNTVNGILSRAKKKLLACLGGVELSNRELAQLLA
jgi:RNA polymerase sigma-70 factor (ECF subfamily)